MNAPMTIAQIFDRAVTLVVRRWRAAVLIAVIASLPEAGQVALLGADPAAARHSGGATVLLSFAFLLLFLCAFAALAMLFTGDDDDANGLALYGLAFRSFWRLFRVSLATGLLLIVGVAAGALVVTAASAVGGAIAAGILAFVVAVAIAPLFFVLETALCIAAIEGTGATISIGAAFRRTLPPGGRVRTALLGYAAVLCYFVPQLVVGTVAEMAAAATAQGWIRVIAVPVELITGLIFFIALTTVAAIDYRVRSEGVDLEAALDAREPA
ncbi:MAG TPA: hypothetical protein VHT53_06825 [Candidatus Elarobacter sp.]|jgi:hypothetical protein|nr:hypothetical protein [Candidatus Elarobacter sp.]